MIVQVSIPVKQARNGSNATTATQTVMVPTIVNETSTVTSSEKIPISTPLLPDYADNAKGTQTKEVPDKLQTSIPYSGDRVQVPFKQEKSPNNIDLQSFGEQVQADISAQKGQKQIASSEASTGISQGRPSEYVGTQGSNATTPKMANKTSTNQTSDMNPTVNIAFDIFMTWNPKMIDPTFPPRLDVIKLLNEAVSFFLFLRTINFIFKALNHIYSTMKKKYVLI